jgi:hypothetical protein
VPVLDLLTPCELVLMVGLLAPFELERWQNPHGHALVRRQFPLSLPKSKASQEHNLQPNESLVSSLRHHTTVGAKLHRMFGQSQT